MKKLFLLVIVAVASIANAQVGNFKIGGNVALPIGILVMHILFLLELM